MCLKAIFNKISLRKSSGASRKSLRKGIPSATSSVILIQDGGPEVVIIGAGAAGLSCAMQLLNNGFSNIQILEAEDRIGGRIYTVPFGNNVVDLGAQFVHGEHGNEVYKVVEHLNLLESSSDIYNNYQCIRSNGEIISQKTVDSLKKAAAHIFEEDIKDVRRTFNEYLRMRFFNCLKSFYSDIYENEVEVAEEFYENLRKLEGAESTFGVEEVSLKSMADYQLCPGDYMLNWKDKGFISFLRVLIKANDDQILGALENHIVFGNTVECIEWDFPDGKARIKSKNDPKRRLADHVVLTVSLGVLKERTETLFKPQLPISKKRAIVALGFSSMCKIYMEFSETFWTEDWSGFATLWRKKDLEHLRRTPHAWLEDIFGIYSVKYQPRLLEAWVVGASVIRLEKLPQEEIKIGLIKLLKDFLKSWVITELISIQVTRWATHPNFRGAYSFHSMLTEELQVTPLDLQEPLVVVVELPRLGLDSGSDHSLKTRAIKPIVQFAGEATSENFFSTVHGAVESGYREANRIIEYYTRAFYPDTE